MAQPGAWLRSNFAWTVIGRAAGVMGVVVAIASLANDVGKSDPPPPTVTSTTQGSPSASSSTTSSTPTAAVTSHGVQFTGQVTLDRATGVDLEKAQNEGHNVDGPNGTVDLYFAAEFLDNELRANNSNFYADEGPEAADQERCSRLVSQRDERGTAQTAFGQIYAFSMTPGQQYCFKTSEKNLAWLRINDRADRFVVLNVTVWNS
jgi:hypothetical protein